VAEAGAAHSRATWKVIASDMPLSLIVYDDAANKKGSEAFAQGDGPASRPRTRDRRDSTLHQDRADQEHGVADRGRALRRGAFLQSRQGAIPGFRAVLEFVSGPLHAGTFAPTNSTIRSAPKCASSRRRASTSRNLPPSAGMQFFGHVKIEAQPVK